MVGNVKKIVTASLLLLSMMTPLITPITIYADSQERVEQIRGELPIVEAYFYDDSESTISAIMDQIPLTLKEVRSPSATDSSHYYFLIDVSTSISEYQIDALKDGMNQFLTSKKPNDSISIITFGEEINLLVNDESNPQSIQTILETISPTEGGTVLFDALAYTTELADISELALKRKLLFVFTDSVDYNLGGYTDDEVKSLLTEGGLPLYAFGFDHGSKENLDNLGALSRSSGGVISIVNADNLASSIVNILAMINEDVKIATFEKHDNIIPSAPTTIEFKLGEESIEYITRFKYSIPDEISPELIHITQDGNQTITLQFSEPVRGAEDEANYHITINDSTIPVSHASYNEPSNTVTLTLLDVTDGGLLTVALNDITDISQENNPVTNHISIDFFLSEPETSEEDSEDIESGTPLAAWLFLGFIALIIIIVVLVNLSKKQKALSNQNIDSQPPKDERLPNTYTTDQGFQNDQVHFLQPIGRTVTFDVSSANGKGKRISLQMSKSLFVGRSDICDIVFDDPQMSRQHFVIEELNDGFAISNLSQGGATFLNGVPIQNKRPLKNGDVIEAASQKLVFRQ